MPRTRSAIGDHHGAMHTRSTSGGRPPIRNPPLTTARVAIPDARTAAARAGKPPCSTSVDTPPVPIGRSPIGGRSGTSRLSDRSGVHRRATSAHARTMRRRTRARRTPCTAAAPESGATNVRASAPPINGHVGRTTRSRRRRAEPAIRSETLRRGCATIRSRHAAPAAPPRQNGTSTARPIANLAASRKDPHGDRREAASPAIAPNVASAARRDKPARPGASQPRHGRLDHLSDDDPPVDQAGALRLSKRMSQLGIASRREADEWIARGWVRVDGRVVSELGARVLPDQHITVDAKARNQQAERVTVLLNKPVGYVSGQAEDGYKPAFVLVTPENHGARTAPGSASCASTCAAWCRPDAWTSTRPASSC